LLTSGNGKRVAAFPATAQLSACYRQGGDVGGNVAAGTLTAWLLNAHNQAPVAG
jgi:hypothetical protein